MPAHLDLAAAFDAGFRGGPLPRGVTALAPEETERRFNVYRNNVAVSLIEALAKRFPVVQRLVGEEFFSAMAHLFAETNRPRSPVLLEWGDSFPEFLEGFPPLTGYSYMADVARIELTRGKAFHAADMPAAPADSFLGIDPSRLFLRLHPSVQVLRLATPAVSIWMQNQPGAKSGTVTLAGREIALVLRTATLDVPVFLVSEGDAVMIESIQSGACLTAAAEAAFWAEGSHDPHPLIFRLVRAGAIVDPKETT